MYNFFYDQVCSIYRNTTSIVNWAEKQTKSVVYETAEIALRSLKSWNLRDTATSRLTDNATHQANIDRRYIVQLWDIIEVWQREYIVTDIISYTDIHNTIDNNSLILRVR